MYWKIEKDVLKVKMEEGEKIRVAPGLYLMYKSHDSIEPSTVSRGCFLKRVLESLKRGMSESSSVLADTIEAETESELWISANLPGEIVDAEVTPSRPLLFNPEAFLACTQGVSIDTAVFLKEFFVNKRPVCLRAQGKGIIWLSALGSAKELNLEDGEVAIVSSRHLLLMPENINFSVIPPKESIFIKGEVAIKLIGPGKVFIQTKTLESIVKEIKAVKL